MKLPLTLLLASSLLALLALAPSPSLASASAPAPAILTLFDSSVAQCNDGTPAGYYVRRSNTSTVWNVYLQGGGLCWNAESCAHRPSVLTSSSEWPSALNVDGGFLGEDVNLVYVPYCTSDLYTGTRAASNDTYRGFSFLGSRVVPAVVDAVRDELRGASQVLFSGSSAGGVGVFTNAEWMRHNWASVSPAPLRMLPDAGWFLNSSNFESGSVPLWEEVTQAVGVWRSNLDSQCAAANPAFPSRCVMAQYVYPYVTHDMLVLKNQMDEWTVNHQGLPVHAPWNAAETAYLNSLARNTTASFVSAGVKNVFSPNCVVHTMLNGHKWSGVTVGGVSLEAAVLRWWKGAGSGPATHLVDTCAGPNCNPTCP